MVDEEYILTCLANMKLISQIYCIVPTNLVDDWIANDVELLDDTTALQVIQST